MRCLSRVLLVVKSSGVSTRLLNGSSVAVESEGQPLVPGHLNWRSSDLPNYQTYMSLKATGLVVAHGILHIPVLMANGSALSAVNATGYGLAAAGIALLAAGASVAATDSGTLAVSGLAAEKVVTLLGESAVPFSEVSAHRATLEEAYLELTRDAVEYRAASLPADTEAAR